MKERENANSWCDTRSTRTLCHNAFVYIIGADYYYLCLVVDFPLDAQ